MTACGQSFALVTAALRKRYKIPFDFIHLAECKKKDVFIQYVT